MWKTGYGKKYRKLNETNKFFTHPIFFVSFSFLYFCQTQFFTPFSTLVPFFSVMLIFFYPTCFPFQFFPVHLAVRVCHCLLFLTICPLWRKAWLFDTLGCIFFPLFFPCFPIGCWVTFRCFYLCYKIRSNIRVNHSDKMDRFYLLCMTTLNHLPVLFGQVKIKTCLAHWFLEKRTEEGLYFFFKEIALNTHT